MNRADEDVPGPVDEGTGCDAFTVSGNQPVSGPDRRRGFDAAQNIASSLPFPAGDVLFLHKGKTVRKTAFAAPAAWGMT